MDIITDQLATWWFVSPIGAVTFVGLTALLVTGAMARILETIENAAWRLRMARQRRATGSDVVAASGSPGSGRMGK